MPEAYRSGRDLPGVRRARDRVSRGCADPSERARFAAHIAHCDGCRSTSSSSAKRSRSSATCPGVDRSRRRGEAPRGLPRLEERGPSASTGGSAGGALRKPADTPLSEAHPRRLGPARSAGARSRPDPARDRANTITGPSRTTPKCRSACRTAKTTNAGLPRQARDGHGTKRAIWNVPSSPRCSDSVCATAEFGQFLASLLYGPRGSRRSVRVFGHGLPVSAIGPRLLSATVRFRVRQRIWTFLAPFVRSARSLGEVCALRWHGNLAGLSRRSAASLVDCGHHLVFETSTCRLRACGCSLHPTGATRSTAYTRDAFGRRCASCCAFDLRARRVERPLGVMRRAGASVPSPRGVLVCAQLLRRSHLSQALKPLIVYPTYGR